MKLSDNPARISFPRDDRSHLFFQSQPTAIRRGAAPVATLLLADDSMTTQKVISLTFADEGIEVLTAADGDTAVKLYHERRPDIVLADVNIPGLNGYEICEEIRKTSDLATTPVVLLVGSFEPFDASEAHRVGANDYLTKPFSSIRRLVATVLAFLDDQSETLEPQAPVDQQVQEISVEPPQEEPIETQADESTIPTAEYDNAEIAPEVEAASEMSIAEEPALDEHVGEAVEPENETLSGVEPTVGSQPPIALVEPDFKATTDIEDLYSQSFAETVEMPHTIAERARFSDVSSDDGLIEAQFTGHAPAEPGPEPVQQTAEVQVHEPGEQAAEQQASEPARWAESGTEFQESAFESEPRAEEQAAEPSAEQTNGFSTWSEPHPAEDQHPVAFDQRPHDAPTERLTPQNATTEEYNFEFRSEEAFFEPAPEPLTGSYDVPPNGDLPASESAEAESAAHPQSQPETAVEAPSTPWETVAAPSDGAIKFDDRNLLEIPGQTDGANERAYPQPELGLSMETVEHIARIVASQMSEQIIREIAERVVPMVVQQTLANKKEESNN